MGCVLQTSVFARSKFACVAFSLALISAAYSSYRYRVNVLLSSCMHLRTLMWSMRTTGTVAIPSVDVALCSWSRYQVRTRDLNEVQVSYYIGKCMHDIDVNDNDPSISNTVTMRYISGRRILINPTHTSSSAIRALSFATSFAVFLPGCSRSTSSSLSNDTGSYA